MNQFIDIYCERLGPGWMAEPLNALTNLAFLLAAYYAYRLAKAQGTLNLNSRILIGFIALIGISSGLFHVTALFWTKLADSLSILFYQIAYLTLYSKSVMRMRTIGSALLLAAFFATTLASGFLPYEWLNGSLSYLPAIVFLSGLGVWHVRHAKTEKSILLAASGVFLLSLTMRSIDMALCPVIAIGTHFLWHILNALVLYLTMRAYIKNAL
jgi:hypothetical protein